MELTPPSMRTSPYSPMVQPVDSPSLHSAALPGFPKTSQTGYPSPELLSYTFKSVTPYLSNDLLGAPSPVSMLSESWGSPGPEVMASDSRRLPVSSSTAGSVLPSTNYDFSLYTHNLDATYSLGGGYSAATPPSSLSPGLSRTPPPPRPSATIASHSSMEPRESFSYAHGGLLEPPGVESLPNYGQVLESRAFPASEIPAMVFNPPESHFGTGSQTYLADSSLPLWSKDDLRGASVFSAASNTSSVAPAAEGSAVPASKKLAARKVGRTPRKHTTREEANFQCVVKGCGKFFSRSYNFKSHMETHDEKREYPFTCQVAGCTKKFVRKTDLQRHHQSVHIKEKNHQCGYCERLFARKDTLRRHMEDGCSKRFDLGPMNMRRDGDDQGPEQFGSNPRPSVAHSLLPPPGGLHPAHDRLQDPTDAHRPTYRGELGGAPVTR